LSEQPSLPPAASPPRASAVRAASFAKASSQVTPAPWLVDGTQVPVRLLFPTDEESPVERKAVERNAEEHDAAAQEVQSAALSLPPPAMMSSPPPASAPAAPPSVAPPARDLHAEAFARAVAEHVTARSRALVAVEEQLLELAVQLAEVLVEHEITRDPQIHAVLVRAALAAIEGTQPSVVRASRAAHAAIVETFGEPNVEVDGTAVAIVLDARLVGLGVVVESQDSRVDGRVAERLRSALRAMQDERRSREAEVAT